MKSGKVESGIVSKLRRRKLHFSLVDPDPKKVSLEKIDKFSELIRSAGSDAIMAGGSTLGVSLSGKLNYLLSGRKPSFTSEFLDSAVTRLKKSGLPVILFPGGLSSLSSKADAVFFMSMQNSKDPKWISHIQAFASQTVRDMKLEPIPMSYLIVEPGMAVGRVGSAAVLPRSRPDKAVSFALAAQYFGFRFVYLEAGSGAPEHVPLDMIKAVKSAISIPLMVGGGIRSPEAASAVARAGADIVVTGTIIEDDPLRLESIVKAVHSVK